MKKKIINIRCDRKIFRAYAFVINPNGEDTALVEQVIADARGLNATTSNPAGVRRSVTTLKNTRYLGSLAELLLRDHLQEVLGPAFKVIREPFSNYASHVDLKIQAGQKQREIEIRCSFPFSRLEYVVCKVFNVIGPYATNYKSGERPKDFYMLGLINEREDQFDYNREHTFYFVGGASYNLLEKKGQRDNLKQRNADYLVLRLAEARDAVDLVEDIRESFDAI